MKGTTAGVAESIQVYHLDGRSPNVHVVDVVWTDTQGNHHGSRRACADATLYTHYRPCHVHTVCVPGVGIVHVDCGVPREPNGDLTWTASLTLGRDLWGLCHDRRARVFTLPITFDTLQSEAVS